MAPYAAMEARLAAELPGVELVDASAALAPYAAEGLLFDRNHLSRAGTERMAELLAPHVAALAGLASPPVAGGPG
jgi:lysophospholipase L1-like esterase